MKPPRPEIKKIASIARIDSIHWKGRDESRSSNTADTRVDTNHPEMDVIPLFVRYSYRLKTTGLLEESSLDSQKIIYLLFHQRLDKVTLRKTPEPRDRNQVSPNPRLGDQKLPRRV